MIKPLIFVGATLLAMAPAWAVNKCTGPDGKVAFQDAPCAGKGEKVDVRPASGSVGTAAPVVQPTAPTATAQTPAPTTAPQQPAAAQAPSVASSPLSREADMCLAWYRPKLRDPAGAYYSEPSKDGRVLTITVHGTNGFGGYVTKRAQCEFLNGKIDSDWTAIHAKRLEW